ncbi:MAG: phage tail protein [Methylibium sp.]|uniref:phage tail protein n=1 Tax=Methylibium sp. TaxID=2067992 RepID=UPI0017CFD608|nr:phage tail protein [Methylibium sp.]MBA3598340.1 phage tail protein [Methylibium sp.]
MAASDPQPAFAFRVEIDGFAEAAFARVQLPRLERDAIRYRSGNDPGEAPRLLPGLLRLGECVLERAVLPGENDFFNWMSTAQGGAQARRNVAITLLDEKGQPVRLWKLRNAIPVALAWSPLDASVSSVLVETLHLAVEAVTVETS